MSSNDGYALRSAARRVVDDLRARAQLARARGDENLVSFLELQANRLEAPLTVDEAAAKHRDEEARTSRLLVGGRWT